MKICPNCEAGYPDELSTCPLHGGLLSEIRDLKPGMLVRNTYRIVRKLSKGGMGNVYLAQHILLNEPQVLKFLSPDLSRDKDWTGRFLREVRSLRMIRHKNVVTAGNLEPAEDGTLFFSMEYIEGPDLHDFYRHAPKPFDIALTLEFIHQVAEGLGAAHAVGVIHRDIKPENILISIEGEKLVPKIADFGIVAKRGDSRITQSGTTMLTPQFAAPEQWTSDSNSELDGRTDLYALGGLLFELLTGRCAFKAYNYQEWAQQHLNTPATPPTSLRPELKNWHGLDELVLSLLAKDPDDRPANVDETLRRLESIIYVAPAVEPAPITIVESTVPDGIANEPTPELVASGTALGEPRFAPASYPRPRARLVSEPIKVWEPIQPRSTPSLRERDNLSEPFPARRPHSRALGTWFVAAVAIIILAFMAHRLMVNEVESRVLTNQKDAIYSLAFSPNGLNLASASRDNTIQFWNVPDGRPLGTIAGITSSLAFSPDGRSLATGMGDYSINIWDADRGNVLGTMAGSTSSVSAVAFSPDGHSLASASWDRSVRVWDVATGHLLHTLNGHIDRLLALAYAPDGRLLASAGADQTICIWEPDTGRLLRNLRGHTQSINSLAFSADGRTLASASDDMTIRLWNSANGLPIRTLQGHTGAVLSIAFSPDGRTLASSSADATIRLWDVPTGQSLRVLKGHTGPVLSVAFSPFGDILASGGSDKIIRLWQVAKLGE